MIFEPNSSGRGDIIAQIGYARHPHIQPTYYLYTENYEAFEVSLTLYFILVKRLF